MKAHEPTTEMHIPVLLKEVLEHFPSLGKQKLFGLDGTLGRGGHTIALLNHCPKLTIIGIDQDQAAVEYCRQNYTQWVDSNRLFIEQVNFVDSPPVVKKYFKEHQIEGLDFILLDLGVSSPQLDQAERGFSFYQDGPLDMRMDQTQELTAATILNEWPEEDLISMFKDLGEVRSPYRVIRALLHDRKEKYFNSTVDFSEMIARIDGWRKKGHHPATKYFLALRLQVNEELEVVDKIIPPFIDLLSPGGRLMIISFHSLEDRIVKRAFKAQMNKGRLVNKKVIIGSDEEQKINPRSRSAKLRIFEKGSLDENKK